MTINPLFLYLLSCNNKKKLAHSREGLFLMYIEEKTFNKFLIVAPHKLGIQWKYSLTTQNCTLQLHLNWIWIETKKLEFYVNLLPSPLSSSLRCICMKVGGRKSSEAFLSIRTIYKCNFLSIRIKTADCRSAALKMNRGREKKFTLWKGQ